MQIYSGRIERRFIANVVQMATGVDTTAMDDTASGPRSLQSKSIRRIRALRAAIDCQLLHMTKPHAVHSHAGRGSLTLKSRIIPISHDNHPVPLHRHKIHGSTQLLNTSQRSQHDEQSRRNQRPSPEPGLISPPGL